MRYLTTLLFLSAILLGSFDDPAWGMNYLETPASDQIEDLREAQASGPYGSALVELRGGIASVGQIFDTLKKDKTCADIGELRAGVRELAKLVRDRQPTLEFPREVDLDLDATATAQVTALKGCTPPPSSLEPLLRGKLAMVARAEKILKSRYGKANRRTLELAVEVQRQWGESNPRLRYCRDPDNSEDSTPPPDDPQAPATEDDSFSREEVKFWNYESTIFDKVTKFSDGFAKVAGALKSKRTDLEAALAKVPRAGAPGTCTPAKP